MRKTAAIFFLIVHVYNLVGYKAVFAYLHKKATSSLVSKLDKGQYREEELIEMKIPYQQLYYSTQPEYVRYDGEIDINGAHFNYVKRKFSNDTLYILCIPNRLDTKLASAKNNYFNNPDSTSALPGKSKSSQPSLMKCFSSDCNFVVNGYDVISPSEIVNKQIVAVKEKLNNSFIPLFDRPPRFVG